MLEAGHHWTDIQTYTLPMVQSFLQLSVRRKAHGLKDMANIMRTAYHADGKEYKKHLSALDE